MIILHKIKLGLSAVRAAVRKAVEARIQRNPVKKQKLVALQVKVSREFVERGINADLLAHRRRYHLFSPRLKIMGKEGSKLFLRRYMANKLRRNL